MWGKQHIPNHRPGGGISKEPKRGRDYKAFGEDNLIEKYKKYMNK